MSQHGVISAEQLRVAGLGARGAQHRAERGALHRVHRGVYSIAPKRMLGRHGLWMAAVLACGEGACLSHLSAAHLYDVRRSSGLIHVTVERRSSLRIAGLRVHRRADPFPTDQRAVVAGIPCTSLARTLLDIAVSVAPEGLKSAMDQAEIRRLDFSGLPALIDASLGRSGVATLRDTARRRGIGLGATRNTLEEALIGICRRAGLPEPRVNHWLDLNDGFSPVELDFYWPRWQAVVETDGGGAHGTLRSIERDYARERRLAGAGIVLTRFSHAEVFGDAIRVGAELAEFLARAARGVALGDGRFDDRSAR